MQWALLLSFIVADTPTALAPPAPARLAVRTVADGVQIYACEAVKESYDWVLKGPEAALFDETGRQVGKHFAGPSWQSLDGSLVTGELVAKAPSPNPDAIAWLLLRAKSHTGSGQFGSVSYVQRVQTKGGAAPSSGCDAAHLHQEVRMRYSAEYLFYSDAP